MGFKKKKFPGKLQHITKSKAGMWGTNANDDIYCWDNKKWKQIPGKLNMVSIGVDGELWGVNASNTVYRWDGMSSWTNISEKTGGLLTHISVGSKGIIWGIGTDTKAYRYTGSGWEGCGGHSIVYLSVNSKGTVIITNSTGGIWTTNNSQAPNCKWVQIQGTLKEAEIDEEGTIYGFSAQGNCYQKTPGQMSAWVDISDKVDCKPQRISASVPGKFFVVDTSGNPLKFNVKGKSDGMCDEKKEKKKEKKKKMKKNMCHICEKEVKVNYSIWKCKECKMKTCTGCYGKAKKKSCDKSEHEWKQKRVQKK